MPRPLGAWESSGTPRRIRRCAVGISPTPGPVEYDRFRPGTHARRTRKNEVGSAGPGSQHSITRGVQNLQFHDSQTRQLVPNTEALSPVLSVRRATVRRPGQQPRKVFLQCAQCGTDPEAYVGHSDHGLMTHMSQKHGEQTLTPESLTQLRQLDRGVCVVRGTIRSRRESLQSLPCGHCDERPCGW